MGRIRSIKPDFFLHEELCELSPLHRLLFVGLWTLADRNGRLEDRPKRIKASLLPWEDCNVDELLTDLGATGFVDRYEVDGKACIAIPGFAKHQRPHPKETDFELPAPPSREISRQAGKRCGPAGKRSDEFPSTPAGSGGGGGGGSGNGGGGGGNPPPPDAVAAPWALNVPAVTAGAQPERRAVARIEPPDTPVDSWSGEDFWRWAQDRRVATKYLPERPPHPRKLSTWWSESRALVRDVKRLKEAYYRYGEDAFWRDKDPPYPFGGFMSQWERFVPAEEGDVHAT